MTMLIKDITDTLATISSYYKSHVGIDLDIEMSIDNDDVMAIDCAIKGLEELQAHREAWGKMETELNAMTNRHYVTRFDYAIKDAIDVVKKYRPKEGDAE